jgi:hypothetical protein
MKKFLPIVALLCFFPALAAFAASHNRDSRPQAPAKPPQITTAHVPLIDQPLHLKDFAGFAPSPALSDKLTHIDGFIQNSPRDGDPETEKTEVYIARTRTEIYFVFLCHDRHPNQIRTHLARRENILKDDNVSVLIDTFQDHRRGVLFSVNPAGVQADAAWSENADQNADYSYDQVWNSEGRVTEQGWMALIAIPFRSLRFPPTSSTWGIILQRVLPRNSENDTWPRIASNISGALTQEGTITGIEGVSGSHNFQLNPYTLGQNEKTLETLDPLNPYFSSRKFEGTAGGEIKAILKDSIVVDATINPDFSDIESDQPQFTVNQRYPVFFPELRPFFLENANYFSTPINLVYTRNIINPEFGIRATGKLHNTNIGLFAIDDREPGNTVAVGDPLYHKRAAIAVGRISQDFGKGSSLGLTYTDYEFGGGFNRIGGVDFTFRFDNHWNMQGQMVESATLGDDDSGTPRPYSAGPATQLSLQRNGHSFNLYSNYTDVSTGYQTLLGFQQSSNIRSTHVHSNYQWFPKNKKVQVMGAEGDVMFAFDHQGNRVYHYLNLDYFFFMPRNTIIAPILILNSDTVGPPSYPILTDYVNFTENAGGIVFRSAPSTVFNFGLQAFHGGNVNYNPPYVQPVIPGQPLVSQAPFLLDQDMVNFKFSIQPMRQLTTDNLYLLDRDHNAHGNAFVYENQVFRTKINYQFTRDISARVIVEYDSILANPAQTSLQRTKQIQTGALLTWLPHPGTALYIGYNNDIQNLDRSLCNRLPQPGSPCDPNNTTPPRSNDYLNDGKQIFVKASYLFRF